MNTQLTDERIAHFVEGLELYVKLYPGSDNGNPFPPADILSAFIELQERRKADSEEPIGWTDAEELRSVERDGCGYLFKANPITPNANLRRVIKLYAAPQPLNDAEWAELQGLRKSNTANFERVIELESELEAANTERQERPIALPGGFSLDDARELHKNLVICHTSKVLSGERMSPAERGNDLAWIRDIAVTAAWFVNAIIESTKLEVSDE